MYVCMYVCMYVHVITVVWIDCFVGILQMPSQVVNHQWIMFKTN